MRLLAGTLAAVALAPASAGAAERFAGGYLPSTPVSRGGLLTNAMALTLDTANPDAVRVHLAVAMRCTRFIGSEADVLSVAGSLAPDGTLRVFQQEYSTELGYAAVSITGRLTDTGGTATARVFSTGIGTGDCDSGHREIAIAPLDDDREVDTTGTPPAGRLLVGISDQDMPVVARVSPDGRRLDSIFVTQLHRALTIDRGRREAGLVDYEVSDRRRPISRGRVRVDRRFRLTQGRERQGMDWTLSGRIGSGGLRATMSGRSFHTGPRYRRTTRMTGVAVRAVPAG